MPQNALSDFHPQLRDWFRDSFETPTEVQESSWPRIRSGEHLLITAPTGSGKTLTAFFSAINAFITGDLPLGRTSVLYVSPLKALNNDIQRNLQGPLAELRRRYEEAGADWPDIRTAVRSGDTPQNERQRMLRTRPEILITTPESLAILLTSARSSQMLATVKTVILDEIHAVLDSRRGAHLMVSLERLVEVAGEFQRIALSATINPLESVARYVGGLGADRRSRVVGIVQTSIEKKIDLRVRFPPSVRDLAESGESVWPAMIEELNHHLQNNESTLIFSDSRRQCERTTYLLNEHAEETVAYAHHGSLSREIRSEVESRLKNGELRGIVATSSLELGIDIGELDEVLLLKAPDSVAAAMQRIGRAGHNVGDVSRATFYPMFARDFLDVAVIAKAVEEADIEPVSILEEPLDLLAQTLVSMVATDDWHVDDIFEVITRAAPYRNLSRRLFDLVVEMLTGKYERTRLRDLRPRIALDEEVQELSIRKGALMALYANGGTIPDRGYYKMKHADTNVVIGELDEEFVWESSEGEQFAFGTQQWVVTNITHNDVYVRPSSSNEALPPFYKSEFINRSFYFSNQVAEFLEQANHALERNQKNLLISDLRNRGFDANAAEELVRYLSEQRAATGCDLPHAKHIVAEVIEAGPGGYSSSGHAHQLVLHTGWGGKVNRPIALCLEAAWEEQFATAPDIVVDNQVIAIQMKQDVSVAEIINMLSPDDLLPKIRRSLEKSGFFGARFRECAGRALLLSKQRFDRRMPLWLTRMQAKDLLNSVSGFDDFPILLETWRSCFRDEFDIDATRKVLSDLESGKIAISECKTDLPSPFAATLAHDQLNRYVYADDQPVGGGRTSSLSDELIAHALRDAALRPAISQSVIERFEAKLQRRESGYAPTSETELVEWVKERVWIRESEWFEDIPIPDGIERINRGSSFWFAHASSVRLAESDRITAIANAMQFYGPHIHEEWLHLLPLSAVEISSAIEDLISTESLVADVAVEGCAELCVCDARNLSTLLRFQRSYSRPTVKAQPVRLLPNFLATWHQFGRERTESTMIDVLERMQGFVAPVRVWLDGLWRPRVGANDVGQLSSVCERFGVNWRGRGKQRIALGIETNFDDDTSESRSDSIIEETFRDPIGSYTYLQLLHASKLNIEDFNERFWAAVWDGAITSDALTALAHADETGYSVQGAMVAQIQRSRVRLRSRMRSERPLGMWRQVVLPVRNDDELERLEDAKECVRTLLGRYGVLSRELCNREGRQYRWSQLFRAMRMMELSGELVSGLFFEEFSGPQFMQPNALDTFLNHVDSPAAFWINSYDPVSPCGLGLKWDELPTRNLGNMLAFNEGELVVTSRGHGKQLDFLVPVDDERLDEICRTMHAAVTNRARMTISAINDGRALDSEYLQVLGRHMQIRRGVQDVYVDAMIR
ncbi:MAG: DEAD/DEAH box helicase [Gammaproteobacteria bacterium]|nr:DEAD/DEAH box helicase [Gammaproteobacteria bacterium]